MLHAAIRSGSTDVLTAFDALPFPIFVLEEVAAGRVVYVKVNPAYERATGRIGALIYGHRPTDVYPARHAETLSRNHQSCLAESAPIVYEEVLTLQGRETWWLTTLVPLVAGSGRGPRIVAAAIDITTTKQREFADAARIARLNLRLSESRVLAGLTAHDMRAPLGTIRSLTDLIIDTIDCGDGGERGESNAEIRQLAGMAGEVANQGIAQIEQIMGEVARTDDATPALTPVDLDHLCRDLVAIVDPASRLSISYPVARLTTDAPALQIALRNLLDNAVRHARTRIEIALQPGTPGAASGRPTDIEGSGPGGRDGASGAGGHPGGPVGRSGPDGRDDADGGCGGDGVRSGGDVLKRQGSADGTNPCIHGDGGGPDGHRGPDRAHRPDRVGVDPDAVGSAAERGALSGRTGVGRPGCGTMVLCVTDDGPGFGSGIDLPTAIDRSRCAGRNRGYGLRAVMDLVEGRGGRLELAKAADGSGASLMLTLPARDIRIGATATFATRQMAAHSTTRPTRGVTRG